MRRMACASTGGYRCSSFRLAEKSPCAPQHPTSPCFCYRAWLQQKMSTLNVVQRFVCCFVVLMNQADPKAFAGSNKVHQLHVRTCSSSPRMLTSMATQMRSRQSVRPAGSENMVSHNRTASGKENSCAFRLALSCNARIGECLPAVQLL